MNREAEFAAKPLPDQLRSITNEALWEYESDAIEAAADALDQARQMLADAPHTDICYYRQRHGDECNCWKAGP